MRYVRIVVLAALVAGTGAALAQDGQPDARMEFSSTSFGLVFGFSQGQGTLDFQSRKHAFTVSGIKVATLGVARVDALGQVYRLRDLADFAGRYVVIEGGLTVVQGGGNAVLRNEKGVMLYLQNVQYGLELTLGGGGVDIALTEPPDASSLAAESGSAR